jgi:hypothetical protein
LFLRPENTIVQREPISGDDLTRLLHRTAEFHERVFNHAATLAPYDEGRFVVAFESGLVSLEHASSSLLLSMESMHTSAITLIRPQFECLLRGLWLMHAAKEHWIRKLSAPMTEENAQRANSIPMPAAMLAELSESPDAPQAIVEQLQECSKTTYRALSSFTHGGFHALSRLRTGYPAEVVYDAQRNSNNMVALSAQMLSILSGDPAAMHPVREMHEEFRDCLFIISGPGQPKHQD